MKNYKRGLEIVLRFLNSIRAMIEQRKGRNFNIRVIVVDSQERVLAGLSLNKTS